MRSGPRHHRQGSSPAPAFDTHEAVASHVADSSDQSSTTTHLTQSGGPRRNEPEPRTPPIPKPQTFTTPTSAAASATLPLSQQRSLLPPLSPSPLRTAGMAASSSALSPTPSRAACGPHAGCVRGSAENARAAAFSNPHCFVARDNPPASVDPA